MSINIFRVRVLLYLSHPPSLSLSLPSPLSLCDENGRDGRTECEMSSLCFVGTEEKEGRETCVEREEKVQSQKRIVRYQLG